jgi:pilus assembly protein CpaD
MTHFSGLLRIALACTALALAACSSLSAKGPDDSQDVELRYPIAVAPAMRVLRLPYGGPGAGLDQNMQGQLEAFVRDYVDHGNGMISVAAPAGRDAASHEIADDVVAMGVPRSHVLVGVDEMPQAGAEIKVSFVRYLAQTKPCGDWSENIATTYDNEPTPNFGCAVQQNIAAMVADPRDFTGPAPMAPEDAQRALTVLDKYRKGQPTAAEKTDAQSGAVSDIGKN